MVALQPPKRTIFSMAEQKKITTTQNKEILDVLERSNLGVKQAIVNKFDETRQTFYRPSGEVVEMSVKEATR